jgi:thymidylate synthase (FAD)
MEEKKAKSNAEKRAIEDARYVFPNACETKIVVTMNARSLYNFFNHRCCQRAQTEIRELATEMLRQVKQVAPTIFKNMGPNCVSGPCPEGSMTCGKAKEMKEFFLNL